MTTEYIIKQEQERELAKVINKKIQIVIGLLGFKEHKPDTENPPYWRASAWTEPKDGLTLHFSQGWGSGASRITISGAYPRTATGEYIRPYGYNEKRRDEITVSAEKSPQQIVNDIERRLLPVCAEYLAYVQKQIASADDYENTTVATLEALKGSPLDEYEKKSKKIGLQGEYCNSAKASRNEVTLEIRVPLEVAQKIVALIPQREVTE